MRVVSLLPSATEIVHALGLGDTLVGRSHECDWPPPVVDLPAVSLARIGSEELSSAEVDRRVTEALARGEELYALDGALVAELRPDVVLTQTLCTVCAVSGDGVRSALRVEGIAAEVVELEPRTLDDVLATIVELGERLGAGGRGPALVAELRARLDAVDAALAGVQTRPSVFVAEWLDPPFAAGHWVPEMVERAGGAEILGVNGQPSHRTSWEEVRRREPSVVLLAPCGYDVDQTLAELDLDRLRLDLSGTPALWADRLYAVDATSYFSRPGPRLVDGVELCAALLHPEAVPDRSPPGAWSRVRAA